jgi:hypothetical protein
MNWGDERYVRVYTRESPDWLCLPWQARALFVEILKRCDRSGVLKVGPHPESTVAVAIYWPPEVVRQFLPVLLEDGCLTLAGTHLVARNYIEAQETAKSDAERKRESREKRRDGALAGVTKRDQVVTKRDGTVTKPDAPVTKPDASVHPSVPCRAVPCDASLAGLETSKTSPAQPGAVAPDPTPAIAGTSPATARPPRTRKPAKTGQAIAGKPRKGVSAVTGATATRPVVSEAIPALRASPETSQVPSRRTAYNRVLQAARAPTRAWLERWTGHLDRLELPRLSGTEGARLAGALAKLWSDLGASEEAKTKVANLVDAWFTDGGKWALDTGFGIAGFQTSIRSLLLRLNGAAVVSDTTRAFRQVQADINAGTLRPSILFPEVRA